jgi:hypothetical protein
VAENVVGDMERGRIDYILVGTVVAGNYFCAVARKGMSLLRGNGEVHA